MSSDVQGTAVSDDHVVDAGWGGSDSEAEHVCSGAPSPDDVSHVGCAHATGQDMCSDAWVVASDSDHADRIDSSVDDGASDLFYPSPASVCNVDGASVIDLSDTESVKPDRQTKRVVTKQNWVNEIKSFGARISQSVCDGCNQVHQPPESSVGDGVLERVPALQDGSVADLSPPCSHIKHDSVVLPSSAEDTFVVSEVVSWGGCNRFPLVSEAWSSEQEFSKTVGLMPCGF